MPPDTEVTEHVCVDCGEPLVRYMEPGMMSSTDGYIDNARFANGVMIDPGQPHHYRCRLRSN